MDESMEEPSGKEPKNSSRTRDTLKNETNEERAKRHENRRKHFFDEVYYQLRFYIYRLKLIKFSRMSRFRKQRKRMLQIFETVETEKKYNSQLKFCVEEIQRPAADILSPIEIKTIFQNLKQISSISSTLTKHMEDGMTQFPLFKINESLKQIIHFFKIYKEYVSEAEQANKMAKKVMKHNKNFKKLCTDVCKKPAANGYNLEGFLIRPIQRIVRYRLLVNNIIKYTDDNHAEKKGLAVSLATIEDVADFVNRVKSEHHNDNIMSRLYKVVKDKSVFRVPFRKFQKDTQCSLLCLQKGINEFKDFSLYLFTDLVILIEGANNKGKVKLKHVVHFVLPLAFTKIKEFEIQEEEMILLETISKKEGKVVSYSLMFDTLDEQDEWFEMIEKNIEHSKRSVTQRTKNLSMMGNENFLNI